MSSCNLENDFFDEDSIIENCILDDQYLVKAMIDNDYTNYSFINEFIVCSICKTLKIILVKLLKSRKIKKYDEKISDLIIHVIYSRIIIKDYIENITLMLIIKLKQHDIILKKS